MFLRFSLRLILALFLQLTAGGAAARARAEAQEFRFQDGGSAIFYTLDIAPWSSGPTRAAPQQWMFVLAGSGCRSMGPYLPEYFTGLEGAAGALRIFILHKRHIAPDADGSHCSEAFVRADHASRWLADQQEFIARQLALSRPQPEPRVLLLGISEGAELVPQLAKKITAVSHLALLSHSGLAPLDAYQALAQRYPHMRQGWQEVQQALAGMPPDQDTARIHGRSWRYWSEAAASTQQHDILASGLPVLLAVGEADTLIPAPAVAQLQQRFLEAGNTNLTILRFPQADHGLQSPERNFLPDFFHQLEGWLAQTVVQKKHATKSK